MPMPRDESQKELVESWRTYLESLEKALDNLEAEFKEGSDMAKVCTDEWCEATEHYIDDIGNALFTIHEPTFSSKEDSQRIKALKRKLHDLYAEYKQVSKSA